MEPTVLVFLVLYYVVVVAIGVWAARKGASNSLEGFLLGGRKVGPLVTALTLQATAMSGFMFLGAGSEGYRMGYWALWYAAGDIGGGVVNLSVIGRRMRRLSKILGSLSSIEYLEHRYPSPATRLVAGTLTIFFLFFYVLAQFIAGGKGMALVTGMPYWLALLIAVGIIMLYTFLGGYFAVAYTDLFQSLVMLVGILWIFGACLVHLGGFSAANEAIQRIDPTYLSVWGKGLVKQDHWGEISGAVLIFSIGYMGWPHVVTRQMAMTHPATARTAAVYSTLWNLCFVSAPYLVGIFAIVILPDLDDAELSILRVADTLLPPAITGLVVAAIMAAIMSTADSILLQTGTIASRDLYQRFLEPNATDRQMVWVSRLLVIAIAVVGYLVALFRPPGVFSVVIFTTSVLGSAFLPCYVCAVWWKRANTPGAIASMLGGALTAFVWQVAGVDVATALHPMLVGVLASSALMVVVSLLTQRVAPLPERVLAAVEAARSIH
ncbi:MAG: sodium/proline symporter [Myxococcales bacterium]|nr:sodium/proline symporter [Myxococcales bacterium]MDH5306351.1 sodium/proline symporter [Myxococcales bacterium]MDH5565146.1 sodium/proline symporter [Myxococcales bacterium]